MTTPFTKPFKLTPEQKKNLETARGRLIIFEQAMNDARQAGLDVSEWEEKYKTAKQRVDGILRVYSR